MTKEPIRMVLKEKGKVDKDTKDGEKTTYKAVFKGHMGEMEVSFSAKAETPEQLDEITLPTLGHEIFIQIVPNPQTTLDDHAPDEGGNKEDPEKPEKPEKPKRSRKKREEVIDVSHRIVDEQKKIGPGGSEEVLDQLRGT